MRTSATSLKPTTAGWLRTPNRPRLRGFTLIELLVVLTILAMVVALVPTAYTKLSESTQYRATLRTVVSDLRQARQQAVSRGIATAFSMDLTQRNYGVGGASLSALPESLKVNVVVAGEQLTPDKVATIVFLPNGGATGGSIELVRSSGEGTRVRIDWLTGQVALERLL